MQATYSALRVSVAEDLLPLCALLHQRGVKHRVFEQSGQQVLEVTQQSQVAQVEALYEAWRRGDFNIELQDKPRQRSGNFTLSWPRVPVTLLLIALSMAGFALFYFQAPLQWLSLFTFTPFVVVDNQLVFQPGSGQYWRYITPAFLHFGWLHIVFNSLWMWELGQKVERVMGPLNMLLLFLVIALVSNASQYAFGGPSLFGGMSGVVYGLLGFSWVGALMQPQWQFRPARGIMVFMVGWLVLCMLGIVEVLGFGAIANAAHAGGLLCGAVLGAAFGWLSRSTHSRV